MEFQRTCDFSILNALVLESLYKKHSLFKGLFTCKSIILIKCYINALILRYQIRMYKACFLKLLLFNFCMFYYNVTQVCVQEYSIISPDAHERSSNEFVSVIIKSTSQLNICIAMLSFYKMLTRKSILLTQA